MMEKFYKVVVPTETPNVFKSSWARNDAEVRYVVGEWSRPPDSMAKRGYGLLVFDTEAHAISYALLMETVSIFECRVRYKCVLKPILGMTYVNNDYIKLRHPISQAVLSPLEHWPVGTLMYSRVMLTRPIDLPPLVGLVVNYTDRLTARMAEINRTEVSHG